MNVFDVPKGWNCVPIWTIATRKDRKGYPDAELLSVYREFGVIKKSDRDDNHNVESEDLSSYKFVKNGDLVLNKMKTWQGSLGVSPYEGIVSPAYYVCELDQNVHRPYIHYLLRSAPYIAMYGSRSKGIRVGQWDLPYEEFREIPVLLPPIKEQLRIADLLTEVLDNKINIIVKGIKHYQNLIEELWISSTTELFNTITERVPLKYIYYVQNGNSLSAEFIAENNLLTTDGIDFIATKDVDTYSGVNMESEIKIPEFLRLQFRIASKGSVLICSEGGSAGKKFAVTNRDVHYGNKLFSCTPRNELSADILYYFFHTQEFRNSFNSRMNGMIGGISKEDFRNILVPHISSEQFEGLRIKMDNGLKQYLMLNSKLEKLLGLLEEYKTSLMTELVTGTRSVA